MIEFTVPGEAPSTPNLREHHMARARRTKAQRAAVARRMPAWTAAPLLVVRLTRVAPRSLDSDNLSAALKGHRDAVAARLRIDDATPLVRWEYAQAKGEPAVVVQAWAVSETAPPSWAHAPVSIRERAATPARRNYTPPRSKPVDAAREAEETFAPACTAVGCEGCEDCS